MRSFLKISAGLLGLLLLYVVGILLFGTFTDWTPKGTQSLPVTAPAAGAPAGIQDSVLRFVTWNVGYGGIGDQDFFFYNKGDFFWTKPGTVRMAKARVAANVFGQEATLKANASDFYLLQEVDTAARRSHYTNQVANARLALPGYFVAFAPNFQSQRVPLPLFQPWDHYGYVVSGLVSAARYPAASAERVQLPGEFPWPSRLFHLDRCALRQLYPVGNAGKMLAVYNIHLSAYDKDGSIRHQQIGALRELALADYAAGHYVVIGGDWNQLPPGFNWFSLNPTVEQIELPKALAFDYLPPGWKYAYDPATATVRESDAPYDAHRSLKSVIDFFVVSPNLRIRSVRGIDQEFMFSDHHPVYLEVELLDSN
ncbi:endonuclease/exonuclease/phosphatase family protein [Neolewinella lacunae]|uniref:Endonuclease/exonuclease/phosphatase family protein n=1 Tax=Neolewinella lacunae TaxID=1517758 RepID=A0A923T991_9BACT|nr:endonuclease/exonuclease/phosphatase family protein [Neolewinella lacunae]MBC6995321.1 endonuclease/exonuclease/phosphatase family protein [Neolewinella lacunae]MDN3633033.1 endonuclease/exonuclease/phosphatase family protein [Neolewinella lacunae]